MAIGRRFYFDSCMREDCNERIRLAGAGNAHILIHACAKIATLMGLCAVRAVQGFDSCMREDCNGKYAQISVLISVYSYDFAAHMFYT